MATTMTPEMVSAFSALRAAEGHLESMRSALYALRTEERGVARQALDAALDAYSLVVETRKAAFSASLAGLSEREENEIVRALEEPELAHEAAAAAEGSTMAKLSIYEAIFVEREMEIPESCPHCGVSFTHAESADPNADRGGNLLEVDHVNLEMQGHLERDRADWGFNALHHLEVGDVYHACLFQCAMCREIVATAGNCTIGKEQEVDGSALARAYLEAREG